MEPSELEPDYGLGELAQLWQVRCAWWQELDHPAGGECLVEGAKGDALYHLGRLGWQELETDGWICPACATALAGREGPDNGAT